MITSHAYHYSSLRTLEDFYHHFNLPIESGLSHSRRMQILTRFKALIKEQKLSLTDDYNNTRQAFILSCTPNLDFDRPPPNCLSIELNGCGKCLSHASRSNRTH
jgi:hypothetical protein